jgi:DNA-binding beta-propeller fold protein YncE
VAEWSSEGSRDGDFDRPQGIAVDGSGNVYVADTVRVQVFSATGEFLRKWGSASRGDGQFSRPGRIAVDGSGNVYVADSANRRVQVFSADGEFLTKWGSVGFNDGEFLGLAGIAVDSSGSVYVVDYGNTMCRRSAPAANSSRSGAQRATARASSSGL